eukprot:GHVO01018099.1.p1 GENE.GHVO01018099.1~~GHVO01018099.1.p1  ORF type:complete len:146 (-),score=22.62 GHVO01018099.1:108-515(-)
MPAVTETIETDQGIVEWSVNMDASHSWGRQRLSPQKTLAAILLFGSVMLMMYILSTCVDTIVSDNTVREGDQAFVNFGKQELRMALRRQEALSESVQNEQHRIEDWRNANPNLNEFVKGLINQSLRLLSDKEPNV